MPSYMLLFRYARADDDMESLERDLSEESGWKLVHGDVFRPPRQVVLLAGETWSTLGVQELSLSC